MLSNARRRALAALPIFALSLAGCATYAPVETTAAPDATQVAAAANTTGWGYPVYDIPADPAVRYGVLDNGMRYAIVKNGTPKDTAVVRYGFDVGWVDETEQTLGLAHMLEHMAFNGSAAIPEGEMLKLLEREGLAFGADTNASTGFEDTIYKLDLPRTDPALLDTALMLMRETASELTLAPDAIDRERGVIQSETRTRNNYQIRRIKDYLQFIAPATRFATRFRADGTTQNIDSFSAATLRDLYEGFYRPDNAVLVIAGDIEPDLVEAKIKDRFADWQAPAAPIDFVDKGTVDLARGAAAKNFVDPDVQYILTIDRFAPYAARPDTVEEFRDKLLLDIGTAVLNRRFQKISSQPDTPVIGGAASASDFFDVARQSSVTLQAKEGEWSEALAVAEQETRRAATHGFTAGEIAEQIANIELQYRMAAEQQATRRSAGLAEAILATRRDEKIFTTPETRYQLFRQLKAHMTPENVSQAFQRQFALSDPLIHVSTKQAITNGEAAILAAYGASTKVAVAPPEDSGATAFSYTDFGTAGTIASDTTIDDLGVRTIRFANNVRLNLKTTDFEDGKARFRVRVGDGQLAMKPDQTADAIFLSAMSPFGGLGKHSFDELQQVLAGRQLTYGFAPEDDRIQVSGNTTMADLPLQMQVSAAYLTDPGFRPEAMSRWQALVPPFVAQTDSTPAAVAQFKVPQIVANGDPRFGFPEEAELTGVTLDGASAIFKDRLSGGPIEITVVGDIDESAVIDAVASTFGALPVRPAALGDYTAARKASFATDRAPITLYHDGAADQALVQTYWPTGDDDDAQEEVTMQLLSEVMGLQLLEKIREELGATYSPNASSSMSDVFDGYGTFSTSVVVAPQQADEVFGAIDAILAGLRAAPVDADTLNRARKPLLERTALNRRENGWWISSIDEAQLRPDRLGRISTIEQRLNAVTPEMLQAAAQRYLDPSDALRVRIVHKSQAE
ncbi:M16 family metallopeptidase [Qipengyuania zhejiangensis]|uniref:M16 family metallopeptidase n=1 Tax=Qipengyuania zhejiangensis TaxID=3077782 RepID=UPI002D79E9C5|nr:insulinase family protein [Qipengyuania sp. Z2]